MTSSSPIFAPVKRVAIPGIIFSVEQDILKTVISCSTNRLEFRSQNKALARLTQPLAKLESKMKIKKGLSLKLSFGNLELLDNKIFFGVSGESGITKELLWMKKHIHQIQMNAFMLKIMDHLMYPVTFNRNSNYELIK